jgi:RHS repeat-associated protein
MTRRISVCALSFVFIVLVGVSSAQVATGTPPFGSFGGGPFDTINLGNLNVNFSIPVLHKAGRGMPFTYDLQYNSSVWYPVGVSGSQTWAPVSNWGWRGITEAATGYVTYTSTSAYCYDGNIRILGLLYHNWSYHDRSGAVHGFNISFNSCNGGPITATATDGSGYTMTADEGSAIVYPASGGKILPPLQGPTGAGSVTDRNGNFFSASVSGSTTFTDTLGTTVLTVSGSGTGASPMQYAYTSPANTSVSVTVHYTDYTVQTNFTCSGIAQYGPSTVSLPSDVTLPDGSQYLFTYEATPSFPGSVTGRMKQITLPTGGTITYTYTGANNGVTCADGSTAGLTRAISPGGTWTYSRSNISGDQWQTTVTDPIIPTGNQTVISFQKDTAGTNNFYETQRQSYQGATTGTLLQTAVTCYDASGTPTPATCPTTAVTAPITRITRFLYLPDSSGRESETDRYFNSYGMPTELDEYDFGSAVVGPLIRKNITSYVSLANHITTPSSVVIKDASNNVVAQTTYSYDETAVTATSGTPQHGGINGARGNLTTIATQVNATQTFYRKFTYYDTGTLNTSTDVSLSSTTNGATTTYVYGSGTSCGNSFPTQVNLPLSLSRSMTWNCTGGVQLSATDQNGNSTSTAYTDSYFWRPASATDQLNNTANVAYLSATATEGTFTFNGNSSTMDGRSKVDGLGRPIVDQRKQGPSASTYDSVQTNYDVAGRVSKTVQTYAASAGSLCSGTCPGTTYAYDSLNRSTSITDAGGGVVSFTYTNNDIYQSVSPAPSGEHWKRKQSEYDGLGRLASVCEVTSVSGSGSCAQTNAQTGFWTKYTYDVLGNLTGVTQNAQAAVGSQQTRSFAFDRLSRITSETNPETGTTTYVYDTDATCGTYVGNLVKRTDAVGNVTCYAYDSLHRVTNITYPNGSYSATTPKKYFVYDVTTVNGITVSNAKGRLAEAYTCTGACSSKTTDLWYSYSKRGEITDAYEVTPHSGGTYHLTQSYWEHGGLKALAGLPGLPTITYGAADGTGLDGEGRITKINASTGTNPLTGVTYVVSGTTQPIGAVTQLTFGSADTDNFSYDPSTGRMTQYKFNIGATPQSVVGDLTWSANGTLRTLAITDPFNSANAQTCTFTYDDLVRQSTANCGSAWNQNFSFDAFGNISKSATVGTAFDATYSVTTNRISTIGSLVPTYDANGNLTNDTAHAYTWDTEGRMLSVDSGTASGVCDLYDALGRMVEKQTGTSCTTSYTEIVYTPTGGRLATMNGQTLLQASVPLVGGAEALYSSSGLFAYRHSDHLGSSRFVSTPSRTKYFDVAYAPYGEDYAGSGTADLSFTGQKKDTASWLYDFMFRKYNAAHGRWMSPDPAGLGAANPGAPQTWNRYAYVGGNPLSNVDPLGLLDDPSCKVNDIGCGGGGQWGSWGGANWGAEGPWGDGINYAAGGGHGAGVEACGVNPFCIHNGGIGPFGSPVAQVLGGNGQYRVGSWTTSTLGTYGLYVNAAVQTDFYSGSGEYLTSLIHSYINLIQFSGTASSGVVPQSYSWADARSDVADGSGYLKAHPVFISVNEIVAGQITVQWSTRTVCGNLGAGASVPPTKAVTVGLYNAGNMDHWKDVVSSWGYSLGSNLGPGYQVSTNSSGTIGGPTVSGVGLSGSYTYGGCLTVP